MALHKDPWQLLPGGQDSGLLQEWSLQGQEDTSLLPQLCQPVGPLLRGSSEQRQQQQLDKLLKAEPLPAFIAHSPTAQRRQQQYGWEADALRGDVGRGWGAASSGSDDLPAFFF